MEDLFSHIKGGAEIWALLVAAASVASVFLRDSKNPKIAKFVNWIALNVGRAKNDPAAN